MGPRPNGAQSGSDWPEEIRANQSSWTGPRVNGSELTALVELVRQKPGLSNNKLIATTTVNRFCQQNRSVPLDGLRCSGYAGPLRTWERVLLGMMSVVLMV